MFVYKIFILMFYALDAAYDESPDKSLGDYLSGLNPFLFEGEGSAVPDIYENFKKSFNERYSEKVTDAEEAYSFCLDFIKKYGVKKAIEVFEKFDKKIWAEVFDESK